MGSSRDQNIFDFLRLFAALSVVIGHTVTLLDSGSVMRYLRFMDGVPLFFILSGYLVYRSYERTAINKTPNSFFYSNRLLRIAPGIYSYLVVTLVVLFILNVVDASIVLDKSFIAWVISYVFLIPVYTPDILRVFGPEGVNLALWTIPVELTFYMLVPLIYYMIKKIGFLKGMVIMTMLSFMGQTVLWSFSEVDQIWYKLYRFTNCIPYLFYFTLGVFWTRMWERVSHKKHVFIIALLSYICLRYIPIFKVALGPIWTITWSIPLSFSILWFGYYGTKKLSVFTRFGDFSYGVYIWHSLVINLILFLNIEMHLNNSVVLHLTVLSLTIILAIISWNAIEKKALGLKRYSIAGN